MNSRQWCRLQGLGDKALNVLENALASGDARVAVPVAMKIVEHVLPKDIEQAMQIRNQGSPEAQREQQRLLCYGQMMDMVVRKSERYGMDLPPEAESLKEQVKKQLEEANLSRRDFNV